MNELLNDYLAFERYADDVVRAERGYARRQRPESMHSTRRRMAVGLVAIAQKIQPSMAIHIE